MDQGDAAFYFAMAIGAITIVAAIFGLWRWR
jgi:hypothetical protein